MADLSVGATVWYYNHDLRRYIPGSHANQVTEREKFQRVAVTGETKRSWVVGHDSLIPKNPAKRVGREPGWHIVRRGGFAYSYALTDEAVDEYCWDQEHRWHIKAAVDRATTAQLRVIAAAVGYEAV